MEEENAYFLPNGCPTCRVTHGQRFVKRHKGENSPQWKGGVSIEKLDGFSQSKYNIWRQSLFLLFKGKCFLTNSDDHNKLRTHHLNSWFNVPEKAL